MMQIYNGDYQHMKIVCTAASVLLLSLFALAEGNFNLRCHVTVPKQYRETPSNPPPNGQPEPTRYTTAYEAFWWNCVAVRATDLEGRCPFVGSGTPAASAGALDGQADANMQIDKLLKRHSRSAVQNYLRSVASTPTAKQKMRPYFEKPTPEVVK